MARNILYLISCVGEMWKTEFSIKFNSYFWIYFFAQVIPYLYNINMYTYGKSNDFINKNICAFVISLIVVLVVLCLVVLYLWSKVAKTEKFDDGPHSLYSLTSGGSALRQDVMLSDAAHDAQYFPLKAHTETSNPFASGHVFSVSEDALRGALHGDGTEKYGQRSYTVTDPLNNVAARRMAVYDAAHRQHNKEGWTGSSPMLSGVEWSYPKGYNYLEQNFLATAGVAPGETMINQPKSEEALFGVVHQGL
jgi:hypothetical protein